MLDELIRQVEAEGGPDPAHRVARAVLLAQELEATAGNLIGHFVDRARGAGCSWGRIGGALGVTRQAAQQRWVLGPPDVAGLERFTDRARDSVTKAGEHAQRLHHGWVGTEHLLLGLLTDPDALSVKALAALGLERDDIERRIAELIPPLVEPLTAPSTFTPRARVVLGATIDHALALGHNYIGTEHLLLALMGERKGIAAQVLEAQGVTAEAVKQQVVSLLSSYVKKG